MIDIIQLIRLHTRGCADVALERVEAQQRFPMEFTDPRCCGTVGSVLVGRVLIWDAHAMTISMTDASQSEWGVQWRE